MKAIWLVAYSASRENISKTGHVWDPDGQSFYLFRRGRKLHVHLRDLKCAATNIIASLVPEIVKLTGSDLVCQDILMSFDVHAIEDDPTSDKSFIRTAAATEVFAPMRSAIWKHLTSDGLIDLNHRIDRQKAEVWLHQDQVVLELILTSFSLTCGITPRPMQMAFTFMKIGDTPRNLYIIGEYVVIAFPRPKNKMKGQNRTAGLWVLPIDLAKPLLLYLGVIRPLSIKILDKVGWSHPYHDTHIFVHNGKNKYGLWDGSHINTIIHTRLAAAVGLAADALDLRQIFQTISKKHFSFLLERPRGRDQGPSPLNAQADHTNIVAICNYAVEQVRAPASFGFSSELSDRFFLCSHTLQAAFGLAGVPQKLNTVLSGMQIHIDEENRRIAMDQARFLICREYHIMEGSVEENVKNISDKKPFLFGIESLRYCCDHISSIGVLNSIPIA